MRKGLSVDELKEKQKEEQKGEEAILNLLEDLGAVPSNVEQTICAEKDMDILKKWLKLAAKVDSVEEFIQVMTESKK